MSRRLLRILLAAALLPGPAVLPLAAQNSLAPVPAPAPPQASPPGNEQLAAIEDAIARQQYAAAERDLGPYLAAHPGDARALYDAGYVAQAQGRREEAQRSFERAIARDPHAFEPQFALGLLLLGGSRPEEARAHILAATALEPSPPDAAVKARAWRALAEIDRRADPAAASRALLEAIRLTAETPDDILLSGEIAAASGETAAAEGIYRRALLARPGDVEATVALAHLLGEEQKYAQAEQLLRDALGGPSRGSGSGQGSGQGSAQGPAQNPAQNPGQNPVGEPGRNSGPDPGRNLAQDSQAARPNPGPDSADPRLSAALASILLKEDRPADAVAILERLHGDRPGDAALTQLLADTLAATGDYASARPLLAALTASDPGNLPLMLSYGDVLVRGQQFAEAERVFEAATRLQPASGEAWSGLAFAASENHQPELTLRALAKRGLYLPDNPSVYFLRATAYDTLHQNRAAAESYRRFLASAQGKFPTQEWQARARLKALGSTP